ncbi:putative cytochrome P450 [Annulohypoxylon maeteangense]|uniref:putative cytochrome P450 n=1 Tax=Annulohypoxylon maeteangense TaxID=1927788 RepID=UPI0020078A26|nr:putative cytochrome P450 [Annulohypoxylon maeteangense]KAI0888409.1 putative cytochrome P450 [Annulohypoxylon maeteangense]
MASLHLPTIWVSTLTAATIFVVAVISKWLRKPRSFNVPVVGAEAGDVNVLKNRYVQEADAVLREGYEKFKDAIFQVVTPDGPRVFLPRKYAQDLKDYSRHEASGMKALADRHIGHYTTIDHESDIMLGAIKIDLNRNLGTFVGDVEQEVAFCFETQFPACEDWTPIDLHDKLLRVVAQASARIFVGYPMCRSEEWLDCSTKFAIDVMTGGEKLKQWHPYLRPIAQYFVPEMTQIRGDHQRALDLLLPELNRRLAEPADPDSSPHNDMIRWMQERARKTGDNSFNNKELANLQMLTATAAIHTTRLAIIHALYDLAARPEYVEPLRNEILEVTKDSKGVLQKQHLTQMKMLDSFMKESQRHSPPSVATYQRKAMIPITLSNGFHIPAGTIVQCNTNILDETPQDWGNPHAFDGFRFYKLRNRTPEDINRFQFASPTYDSMQFGFGKDACPGRFFASNQIKIILAYILSHYDIKFEDGVVGRPKNFMFEVNVLADPTKMVLFKKIR